MRLAASILTLAVVVAFGYFIILDARSGTIVDWYKPSPPKKAKRIAHATLTPIAGQKPLYKITFTDTAAKRIGIKTVAVREARADRKRKLTGTIESGGDGALHVVVALAGRTDEPMPGQVATVRPLGNDRLGLEAQLVEVGKVDGSSDGQRLARLVVKGRTAGLAPGDRVLVEMRIGAERTHMIVPSRAVVIDAKGATFVYTTSEPRSFVRAPVTVDYVDAEIAYLIEGPAAGTEVAAGGVVEISGTESRIGAVGISASF